MYLHGCNYHIAMAYCTMIFTVVPIPLVDINGPIQSLLLELPRFKHKCIRIFFKLNAIGWVFLRSPGGLKECNEKWSKRGVFVDVRVYRADANGYGCFPKLVPFLMVLPPLGSGYMLPGIPYHSRRSFFSGWRCRRSFWPCWPKR